MSKLDLEAAVRILADAAHLRADQKAALQTALGDDEKEAAAAKALAEADAKIVAARAPKPAPKSKKTKK